MFEMAAWKTVFGAVGVLSLLSIPVVLWMRRRTLWNARRSGHAWGGVLEDGPGESAPDGWEDVSSRFINDFIPDDVDEDQKRGARSESVREVAAHSPGSLDRMEEGVRIIEGEKSGVAPEDGPLPEDGEKPVLPADKATTAEPGAPWREGLPASPGVKCPRGAGELPADTLDEPPGPLAQVDREMRFENVLANEGIPGVAEANSGADAPLRIRIPAVSAVRDDAPDDMLSEAASEFQLDPQFEEHDDGPVPGERESDAASPDSQVLEPEEIPSTPESEEESVPASVVEEDVISLIQRERAEDDAFSQSAALHQEPGETEAVEELDLPVDEDAGQLAPGGTLPPTASHEAPANTPSELIRELVADICPEDLLLAENMEQQLPTWTPGVVHAAGIDFDQRESTRRAPASEEYLRLAILEIMMGRNEDATGHLKESLRRASRLAPVLNALAVASYQREKVKPAISYSREAFRETGRDVPVQAVVLRNLGYFYQHKGDDAKAAESYENALACIGPQGEIEQLSTLRMRVGRLFRRLGDMEKAREHLSEAARLFHRLGDRLYESRAHAALASVLSETGEYEAAHESLAEALNLCQKIGDKAGEALVYSQMGASFADQEQFTRALRYYENALRLNRGLENRKGEAANLSGMGNIHYARGDLPEACEAYEAALEINRGQGDVLAQGIVLGSLGRVHFDAREWEASCECLTEARRIFQELGASEALDSIMKMLRELDKRIDA